MKEERLTILYSGRVQRVGFRWSTLNALEGMPVTGYVRNLADGRVELVMEGMTADLAAAAERVRRTMAGYIADEQQAIGTATGEFTGMDVKR